MWRLVEAKGEIPSARFGHSMCAVGSSLFLFGGREGTAIDERLLNDLYRFDCETSTWSLVSSSGSLPCPRSYHSMVAATCGTLYVFGGCPAAGRLADLHQLDTKTGLWSQLPSGEMEGRGGTPLALAQDGSSLYVVGGFAGREMADIHRFDIASKTWSKEEQVVGDSHDYYLIMFSCPRSCPRVSVWPSVPDWLTSSCSCTEGSWSRVPGATLGPATSAARRSSSGPGSPGR